ncbi:MAG: pilus assembly protein [Actinomycetales bacterium]|nr:pilus assembly protein [Actinomycetales bacterium]
MPTTQLRRARHPARHARPLRSGDRGSTSLEIAIVFPVLLVLITAVIQYGLWFHARSVALTAAEEGVTAARTTGAPAGAGTDRALTFVAEHASASLLDPTAHQTATPTEVTVTVTGRSLAVLPGLAMAVTGTASGPVERLTTLEDAP